MHSFEVVVRTWPALWPDFIDFFAISGEGDR